MIFATSAADTAPLPRTETVCDALANADGSLVFGTIGLGQAVYGVARQSTEPAVQIQPTADARAAHSRIMLPVSSGIGDTCTMGMTRRGEQVMTAGNERDSVPKDC